MTKKTRKLTQKVHDFTLKALAMLSVARWFIALFVSAFEMWNIYATIITVISIAYIMLFLMVNDPAKGGGILYKLGYMDIDGRLIPSKMRIANRRMEKERLLSAKHNYKFLKEEIKCQARTIIEEEY